MQKKLVMLFIAILLAFVILVGRITYINASSGEDYTKTVLDQQQYMSRSIPFKRGDIDDDLGYHHGNSFISNIIRKSDSPTEEIY